MKFISATTMSLVLLSTAFMAQEAEAKFRGRSSFSKSVSVSRGIPKTPTIPINKPNVQPTQSTTNPTVGANTKPVKSSDNSSSTSTSLLTGVAVGAGTVMIVEAMTDSERVKETEVINNKVADNTSLAGNYTNSGDKYCDFRSIVMIILAVVLFSMLITLPIDNRKPKGLSML